MFVLGGGSSWGGGRGVAFFWEMGRYFCFVRKSKSRDEKIALDFKLFFLITEAHLLFSPALLGAGKGGLGRHWHRMQSCRDCVMCIGQHSHHCPQCCCRYHVKHHLYLTVVPALSQQNLFPIA